MMGTIVSSVSLPDKIRKNYAEPEACALQGLFKLNENVHEKIRSIHQHSH